MFGNCSLEDEQEKHTRSMNGQKFLIILTMFCRHVKLCYYLALIKPKYRLMKTFIAMALILLLACTPGILAQSPPFDMEIEQITFGTKHHFFGYIGLRTRDA